MATVRPISERKLEANRANARKSTGPRTEAGKGVSRMNAVTHGLLAQTVVITAGDYREDAQAFAQLLEGLREDFMPVGIAEDLEVQTLARCYWRKVRAARYEHGATRKRTGDLRARKERRREVSLDVDLEFGSDLENSARGLQYLIDTLEETKQEIRDGEVSEERREWLEQNFPDEFARSDETSSWVQRVERAARAATDGPPIVDGSDGADDGHEMVDKIDERLRRLYPLRDTIAEREALNLESEIHAAALPAPAVVAKLIRYEAHNDRELGRTLQRLEAMQARRRKLGGTLAEQ